jgi:glucans biosynthesis protein C
MQSQAFPQPAAGARPEKARLYYLDWLRVIATLGVFLFHASNVFNNAGFEIKNAEQSEAITMIQGFFFPWGMPLFFLVAGAGSYFALRRRSAGEFTRERTLRLLVPFLTGTFVLGPIQIYLSWRHRTETGVLDWTLLEFVAERLSRIGPKLFGAIGYHMWFLGYLFAFSLLALPLFMWLKGQAGRRVIAHLAQFCEHRGGILLFILPLAAVRLALQPYFPIEHDWADFFSFGAFFVLGYLLFADERFIRAIRRDGWILLGVGIAAMLAFGAVTFSLGALDIEKPPDTFAGFLFWGLVATNGWCWTAFMLFIGVRSMDHSNRVLRYGLEVLLPFFVLHQAVIVVIAYFVVQWDTGMLPKMLAVFLGSFAMTLGLVELVVRRVALLRAAFGMKGGPHDEQRLGSGGAPVHA